MRKILYPILWMMCSLSCFAQGGEHFFHSLKEKDVASDPSYQWYQFGPGMSGNNKSAFWHPTDPKVLFIGPNMGNSYRSTDGGFTYESVLDPDGPGLNEGLRGPREFRSVDFSRQNPDFGFCTDRNNNGIYVTHNKGATWQNILEPQFDNKFMACITVDPKDDQVWYVGGGKMRELGRALFPQSKPHGANIHPKSQGQIYKTTNGGKTWKLIVNGIHPKTEVESILVDPNSSKTVYASTNRGFYKSTNGGKTWKQKTKGFGHEIMRSFTHHYDTNTKKLTLFVINNVTWKKEGQTIIDDKGGIFRSDDEGESWVNISGDIAIDMRQFQSIPSIMKSYYHAIAYYFGMKDKEAKMAFPELPSSITQRFNTIEVDPNDINNIYVNNEYSNASRNNFMPGQLWRTKDGGKHWFVTFRNGQNWEAKSNDADYWTKRNNPIGNNIQLKYLKRWMARDPYDRKGCNFVRFNCDGSILHTQMAKISLFSYDKGDTWIDIDDIEIGKGNYVGGGNSNLPGHGFYQHPDLPHQVFCAAGENSLWITNDLGKEVRKGAQSASVHKFNEHEQSLSTFAIHPTDTNIRYALFFRQHNRGELFRTIDAGKTWQSHGEAIPKWNVKAHSGDQSVHQLNITFNIENPDIMYFHVPKNARALEYVGDSQTGFGVHCSTDGGKTWESINNGLPLDPDLSAIATHPKKATVLFAAVQNKNGGLFKSKDGGDTWQKVGSTKEISGTFGINDIHFDKKGNAYITAGCKKSGINDGGLWRSTDGMKTWEKIFDYPWTVRVETALYDHNVILISTLPNVSNKRKNPGTYLSKDAGRTWVKINKGNGQSDRINDIAIDNYTPDKFYVSTYGSGWYVTFKEEEL
ncbi:sialidase family protein [Flammeovirga sp. SubArs3]|uniref:sialidase family protein n=1 Tax=Flammeovirga sp. SubArs3 TaxID=2995316 RepID=UPI00248CF03C|nr:sialidase family protein [Flammeovirga sp. SubArs3]